MFRLALTLSLVLLHSAGWACSVCFGDPNSLMSQGLNRGVLTMVGVVLVLWVGFGSFFVYLWRRQRAAKG